MRVSLFDCPVDILSMSETLALVHGAMAQGTPLHHVAINVAKLVNMRSDPDLSGDVKAANIITIDGMGIAYALRLRGYSVPERVTGIGLMEALLEVCARDGFRPYLLGATPEVLGQAVGSIRSRHPGISIAGFRDGYFSREQEASVVAEIAASGADCLFVGMPTPRKERFLARHRESLNVPFTMGVGGAFDVISGHVARAPLAMQDHGLEWLYRIYQEPGRMWWRYARTNTIFAGMLLSDVMRRQFGGMAR